jgi:hypothetical protein
MFSMLKFWGPPKLQQPRPLDRLKGLSACLAKLPEELLILIVQFACDDPSTDYYSAKSFCCASSWTRAIAEPLLYRAVTIHRWKCLQSVLNASGLSYTTALDLRIRATGHSYADYVKRQGKPKSNISAILHNTPHLFHLTINVTLLHIFSGFDDTMLTHMAKRLSIHPVEDDMTTTDLFSTFTLEQTSIVSLVTHLELDLGEYMQHPPFDGIDRVFASVTHLAWTIDGPVPRSPNYYLSVLGSDISDEFQNKLSTKLQLIIFHVLCDEGTEGEINRSAEQSFLAYRWPRERCAVIIDSRHRYSIGVGDGEDIWTRASRRG